MSNADEQFTPETVDERIEHHIREEKEQMSSRFVSSEARLVINLHEVYEEDSRVLERVRLHLTQHIEQKMPIPAKDVDMEHSVDDLFYQNVRPRSMKNTIKGKISARVAAFTATVCVAGLVASLILVFTLAHQSRNKQTVTIGTCASRTMTGNLPGSDTTSSNQTGLYLVALDGLYRLETISGKVSWFFQLDPHIPSGKGVSSTILTSPVATHDTVYFGGVDNQQFGQNYLFALNAINGTLRWKFPIIGEMHSLQLVDNILYGSVSDRYPATTGHIMAFDASNGKVRWSSPFNFYNTSIGSIIGGMLYVSSGNTLFALNISNGHILWSYTTSASMIFGTPQFVNGTLYVTQVSQANDAIPTKGSGYVDAIDPQCGNVLWQSKKFAAQISFQPAIADGSIFIGSVDGYAYALDTNTGKLNWQYKTGGSINSIFGDPQAANGKVFFYAVNETIGASTSNSNFFALDTAHGTRLWSASIPTDRGSPGFQPGVFSDKIIYATSDGVIHLIKTSNGTSAGQWDHVIQVHPYGDLPNFYIFYNI